MFPYVEEEGARYLVCPECRVYRHQSRVRLQSHYEVCVTGTPDHLAKIYPCRPCGKVFRSQSWLTRHKNQHPAVVSTMVPNEPLPALVIDEAPVGPVIAGSEASASAPAVAPISTRLDFIRTTNEGDQVYYNCVVCDSRYKRFYDVLKHYAWLH